MSATRSTRSSLPAMGFVRAGVLAAGAGALVIAANTAPVRTPNGATAATANVAVDAVALVCPGGMAKTPAQVSVASAPKGVSAMLHDGGSVQRVNASAAPEHVVLSRGDAVTSRETVGPVVLRATGAAAPGFSGVQYDTAAGVVSARVCAPGTAESWIPVGDKQAGRLLTLVLVNSGSHAASVDVDVRAADGDVPAAAIVDKAVPAHSRVEVNVPADALAHVAPVVHVRSEGSAVQASVRDEAASGDVRGSELTAQYAVADRNQSIPAVPVVGGRARVRLVAPDDRAAVVRLQAWDEGRGASRDTVVTVPAGRTVDVGLTGLKGHFAAVRAQSEQPIVVSGLGASAATGAKDFAWAPATPDLGETSGLTLRGAGAAGTLALMTEGTVRTVTVTVVGAGGMATTKKVPVPAGGAASVPVGKDESVWVSAPVTQGRSGVHGSVLIGDLSSNGARSVATLVPAPWKRSPIAVAQR